MFYKCFYHHIKKNILRWNKKCYWHLIGGSGFLNWPSQEVLYRFSVSYVYTFSFSFKTRAFILVNKWSAHEMVSRILNYLFVSVIFTKCFNFLICFVYFNSCKHLMCRSIDKFFLVRQLFFWWFSVNRWFFLMRFFWLKIKTV